MAFEICQPTQISKRPEVEPSGLVSRKSEGGFQLFFLCFVFGSKFYLMANFLRKYLKAVLTVYCSIIDILTFLRVLIHILELGDNPTFEHSLAVFHPT